MSTHWIQVFHLHSTVLGHAHINQRRYDIRAPLCAYHVIKIVLNVQIYMGAWAWNVKISIGYSIHKSAIRAYVSHESAVSSSLKEI